MQKCISVYKGLEHFQNIPLGFYIVSLTILLVFL